MILNAGGVPSPPASPQSPSATMPCHDFDTVVIGGGSAGYAAARTLAKAGQRVAVVDGARELGGLCILRGCMPTKALLHAAELRQAIRSAHHWGISTPSVQIDPHALFARKDALIHEFATYRQQQLLNGPFHLIRDTTAFTDPHTLSFTNHPPVSAAHFIIATGSVVAPPPIDSLRIAGYLTSDSALASPRIPESLVVLGGGAVALEFAQFYARMGSTVTVVQRGDQLLRGLDSDVAHELSKALEREGIRVLTGTQLLSAESNERGKSVRLRHNNTEISINASEIFFGLGRRPATDSLQLQRAGVEVRSSGHIRTNAQQQSTAPHIYAAGDCCGPHEVVHIAIQQGELAARHLLDPARTETLDDRGLLKVVFTDPAVAVVGLGEVDAARAGRTVRSASYPFNDHGKSIILGCQEGFVKLVADAGTGELLGGACVGPQAGELIHEVAVAIAARLTAAQFAAIPHYHPTLAEIWSYPAEDLAEHG